VEQVKLTTRVVSPNPLIREYRNPMSERIQLWRWSMDINP
jgi:hypothetical protein